MIDPFIKQLLIKLIKVTDLRDIIFCNCDGGDHMKKMVRSNVKKVIFARTGKQCTQLYLSWF